MSILSLQQISGGVLLCCSRLLHKYCLRSSYHLLLLSLVKPFFIELGLLCNDTFDFFLATDATGCGRS